MVTFMSYVIPILMGVSMHGFIGSYGSKNSKGIFLDFRTALFLFLINYLASVFHNDSDYSTRTRLCYPTNNDRAQPSCKILRIYINGRVHAQNPGAQGHLRSKWKSTWCILLGTW